jgi:hypothetical protein
MIRIAQCLILLVASASAQSLDGVWQSHGYGYIYEIHGATLKALEVTTGTCVPGFTANRLTIALAGREATFKAKDGDVFFISPGSDVDHKLLVHHEGLSNIKIDRLSRMPAVCDLLTANTPLGNFDVFTRTFAEHYVALDLRHLDWNKAVAENRLKVTAQTRPTELYELIESMLRPLGDLHTGVDAPKLKRHSQEYFRPGTDRVIKGNIDRFASKGRRALFAVTDSAYLHGSIRKFCNDQIQYGHIDKTTGYLRFLSFDSYSKHGGFAAGLAALHSALDEVFADSTLEALVIDVRLSFGGDDRYGVAIASRLAKTEYLAYAIQARADPVERDRWTTAEPVFVRPSSRPRFLGRVVELIGPITMSAAETFTQALMGRTPHVTRIGESTQGVFCDVLERRLPNGWTFALPNAVFRTEEGEAFDVRGIPPDIGAPVFADDDVTAGRDPGMAAAVRILKQ